MQAGALALSVALSLGLVAAGCSEGSSVEDESCSVSCGCPANDVSGTCTGEVEASMSCGSGALTCDETTDQYGTLVSETCEYDGGERFWCATELDQLGRITSLGCGLEGEAPSCSWP
ncbi:MAG: hypothetical protein HYY06_22785 [Deltaproteobacteria bacterium]|nr:hypothetical protein [Deltaproteobacteria bacterium]